MWRTDDQSLVRARSLQRNPIAGRWSGDSLREVNLRLQDCLYRSSAEPIGRREPSQGFEDRPAPEDAQTSTRARSVHDLSADKADAKNSHAGNFLVLYNKYGGEGEKVVYARHTDMNKCGEQHAPMPCRVMCMCR